MCTQKLYQGFLTTKDVKCVIMGISIMALDQTNSTCRKHLFARCSISQIVIEHGTPIYDQKHFCEVPPVLLLCCTCTWACMHN